MARYKLQDSVWFIIGETLKIYMSNFFKFLVYMAFPILGQLIGIIWVFVSTFIFTDNFEYLAAKFPAMNDFSSFFLIMLLVALPGLLLFMAAFWQYLIAYGALNSMTEGVLSTGHVYDFASHKEVVTRKTPKYIGLWLVYSIFVMLASFPLFWVLGGIFFIYFILIFQAFTFEEDMSIADYFRKSFDLIKGNFAKTIALVLFLVILTFYVIPLGFSVIFDVLQLTNPITNSIVPLVSVLPLDTYNQFLQSFNMELLTPEIISKEIFGQGIFFVAFGFTLPIRSICWTLWYKCLNDKKGSKKSGK